MNLSPIIFHIPSGIRKQATLLIDQQFWLFGCDVRFPQGNLLIAHGFERCRPPEEWKAATQYQLEMPGGCLRLWGFGFWIKSHQHNQGVLVRRGEFAPRLCALDGPVWRAESLPCGSLPSSLQEIGYTWQMIHQVFVWFADYESSVIQQCGLGYRQQCLTAWTKQRLGRAEELPELWHNLAHQIAQSALAMQSKIVS